MNQKDLVPVEFCTSYSEAPLVPHASVPRKPPAHEVPTTPTEPLAGTDRPFVMLNLELLVLLISILNVPLLLYDWIDPERTPQAFAWSVTLNPK